ncbi:MAG: CubicO group peptidase (beta-lactamase class C family) [Planctomycetota bacterium]|jgi:CubicO group peptidase (beta-lactamase class C family)
MTLTRSGIGVVSFGVLAAGLCGRQTLAQDAPGFDLEEEVPRLVGEAISAGEMSGGAVAIDIGGELVYSGAFGRSEQAPRSAVTVATAFPALALNDAWIATAVLQLVEKGTLDLDAPLGTYLPAFEESELGLNLHYLISHTSGLPPLERIALTDGADPENREALCALIANGSLDDAPGTCYRYTSADTLLSGMVLMHATKSSFQDVLRTQILEPAGMQDSGLCDDGTIETGELASQRLAGTSADDLSASPWLGAGCFCTTVTDLLSFQRSLVDGTLLGEGSWKSMSRAKRLRDGSPVSGGYGLQLAPLDEHDGFTIGGSGLGARTYSAYYPAFDMSISIQAFGDTAPLESIGRQIARSFLDVPAQNVSRESIDIEDIAQYVGTYQVGCTHLEVRAQEGVLYFDTWLRPNLKLVYFGDHVFGAESDAEVRLTFMLKGGLVTVLVVEEHGVVQRAGRIN